MANITKAELIDAIAGSAGVSKVQAEAVLGSFFDFTTDSAKAGNKVSWPGFGSFSLKENAARTGRNPQTGEPVKIKASKGMRFTASSTLKTTLNTKGKKK